MGSWEDFQTTIDGLRRGNLIDATTYVQVSRLHSGCGLVQALHNKVGNGNRKSSLKKDLKSSIQVAAPAQKTYLPRKLISGRRCSNTQEKPDDLFLVAANHYLKCEQQKMLLTWHTLYSDYQRVNSTMSGFYVVLVGLLMYIEWGWTRMSSISHLVAQFEISLKVTRNVPVPKFKYLFLALLSCLYFRTSQRNRSIIQQVHDYIIDPSRWNCDQGTNPDRYSSIVLITSCFLSVCCEMLRNPVMSKKGFHLDVSRFTQHLNFLKRSTYSILLFRKIKEFELLNDLISRGLSRDLFDPPLIRPLPTMEEYRNSAVASFNNFNEEFQADNMEKHDDLNFLSENLLTIMDDFPENKRPISDKIQLDCLRKESLSSVQSKSLLIKKKFKESVFGKPVDVSPVVFSSDLTLNEEDDLVSSKNKETVMAHKQVAPKPHPIRSISLSKISDFRSKDACISSMLKHDKVSSCTLNQERSNSLYRLPLKFQYNFNRQKEMADIISKKKEETKKDEFVFDSMMEKWSKFFSETIS